MDSIKIQQANMSGGRTTTSTSTDSSSHPRRDWSKAQAAWKQVYLAKKDDFEQLHGVVGALQAIIESLDAGPDFANKSELIDNLSVCQDGCKDVHNNVKAETKQAWEAYKAFRDEKTVPMLLKVQDKFMSDAVAMLHTVDEDMAVGQLRILLLTGVNTMSTSLREKNLKKVDEPVTKVTKTCPPTNTKAQLPVKENVDRSFKPNYSACKIKYKQVQASKSAAKTTPTIKPHEKANAVDSKTTEKDTTKKRIKLSDYLGQKAAKKPSEASIPLSTSKQEQHPVDNQVVLSTENKDEVDQNMTGDEASSSETATALVEKVNDEEITETVVGTVDSTEEKESSSIEETTKDTATDAEDEKTAAAEVASPEPSEHTTLGSSKETINGNTKARDDTKQVSSKSVSLEDSKASSSGTSKKEKPTARPARPGRSGFRKTGQLGVAYRVDRRKKRTLPQEEVESDHDSKSSSDDEAWLGPAGFISAGKVAKPRIQKPKKIEKASIPKNGENDETRESRKPAPKKAEKSDDSIKQKSEDKKTNAPAGPATNKADKARELNKPATTTKSAPTTGTSNKENTPSIGLFSQPKIRYRTHPAPPNPSKRKREADDDDDEAPPPPKVARKKAPLRNRDVQRPPWRY